MSVSGDIARHILSLDWVQHFSSWAPAGLTHLFKLLHFLPLLAGWSCSVLPLRGSTHASERKICLYLFFPTD